LAARDHYCAMERCEYGLAHHECYQLKTGRVEGERYTGAQSSSEPCHSPAGAAWVQVVAEDDQEVMRDSIHLQDRCKGDACKAGKLALAAGPSVGLGAAGL